MNYRIFNRILQSEFNLPELPEVDCGEPELYVRWGSDSHVDANQYRRVFEWSDPQGDVNCWCDRLGQDYVFTFPGLVSYRVKDGVQIECLPEPGCDEGLVRHFLLNQVVPRCLGSSGELVVHAGAVCLENSKGVAFLGNTGYGKSTLVSSFYHSGAKLISDDGLLLDIGERGVFMSGGLPGLRLLSDSIGAVFGNDAGFQPLSGATDKYQLGLESVAERHIGGYPLNAVFVLEQSPVSGRIDEVTIEPIQGAEPLMSIIRHLFLLDPTERSVLEKSFRNVGEAIAGHLPFYRLRYPREHSRLAEVRQAVMRCVG